jgi:hypothetical protein
LLLYLTVTALLESIDKRRRRRLFRSRPVLAFDEWYSRYVESLNVSRDVARAVAECLAQSLRCDATQFLPSDRFDREFRVPQRCILGINGDDAMLQVMHDLEVLFGREPASEERPQTVGELLQLGARLIEQNRTFKRAQ